MKELGFLELATAEVRGWLIGGAAGTHLKPLNVQAHWCPTILLHWDKIPSENTSLRPPKIPMAVETVEGRRDVEEAKIFAALKDLTSQ